jgi:hypothetical protein
MEEESDFQDGFSVHERGGDKFELDALRRVEMSLLQVCLNVC